MDEMMNVQPELSCHLAAAAAVKWIVLFQCCVSLSCNVAHRAPTFDHWNWNWHHSIFFLLAEWGHVSHWSHFEAPPLWVDRQLVHSLWDIWWHKFVKWTSFHKLFFQVGFDEHKCFRSFVVMDQQFSALHAQWPIKHWTAAQQWHLLSQQSWDQCVWFCLHLCWFCSPSVRSILRQTSFQVDFGGEETVGSSIRLLILSSEFVWMSPFFFCGMHKWFLSLRANSWFLGSFLKASSNVLSQNPNGGMWNVKARWSILHMTGISSMHFVKWASTFVIAWPTFVNMWLLFRTLTKHEFCCRKHQFVILRSTRVKKGIVTLGFNINFFIITFIITVLCKKRHVGAARNVVIVIFLRARIRAGNNHGRCWVRLPCQVGTHGMDLSSQKGSVTWNFHMMAFKGVKFCKLWRSGGSAP